MIISLLDTILFYCFHGTTDVGNTGDGKDGGCCALCRHKQKKLRSLNLLNPTQTIRFHRRFAVRKPAAATFLHPFTVGDPIKENHSKSSVYLMSVFQVIPKPIHGHSRKEFLHPQILLIQILWIQLCLFILDLYKHNFFEKNENWESRRRVGKGISFG
jgi:hypothetical protein